MGSEWSSCRHGNAADPLWRPTSRSPSWVLLLIQQEIGLKPDGHVAVIGNNVPEVHQPLARQILFSASWQGRTWSTQLSPLVSQVLRTGLEMLTGMPDGQLGFWLAMFVLSPLGPNSSLRLSGKSRKNNTDLKHHIGERKREVRRGWALVCVYFHVGSASLGGVNVQPLEALSHLHGDLEMTWETGFG